MTQSQTVDFRIPAPAVRAELARILASEPFARSPRMQRFLEFIVEESLAGRGRELGEYIIGVSVFDRGPDFEPALDPIVRNDARRLRAKLTEYYQQPQAEPAKVLIEMPKGGYTPSFLPPPVATTTPCASHRLAVFPFESICATRDGEMCGRALCMSLTAGFTNLDGMEAVAHGYVDGHGLRDAASELKLSHVLNGCVWKSGDRCQVVVNLIQVSRGTQLWARTYEIGAGEMLSVPAELAGQIVAEVRACLKRSAEPGQPRLLRVAA